jgi:hypothetical protein
VGGRENPHPANPIFILSWSTLHTHMSFYPFIVLHCFARNPTCFYSSLNRSM